jgi:hypothetical protein
MKLSGFTIIRNGSDLHYPFIESINSLLPIVDEYIVLVCESTDNTRELISNIKNDKIKIYDSDWDTKMKSDVFSLKTNEALKYITGDYGFYLQGDELIHEKDYDLILKTLKNNINNTAIKGFVFDYIHFLGGFFSYPKKEYVEKIFCYAMETRIIRNDKTVMSFGDATGFTEIGGKPVSLENGNALKIEGANIYHYGKALRPEYNYRKELNTVSINYGKFFKRLKTWAFNFSPRVDRYVFSDVDFLEFIDRSNIGFHPEPIRRLVSSQDWDLTDFKNFKKKNSGFVKFIKIVVYRIISEITTGIKKLTKK